ncbi:MAG TPA: hypothetical protein VFH73_14630, partial [Polyangia bacterium]|nr:hypothetical protein [Polyangia bacterium]
GGVCVIGFVTTIGNAGPCVIPIVFCRYPNDPCRTGADCAGFPAKVCLPNGRPSGPSCVDNPFPSSPPNGL